jgi:hypothetical protein
MNLDEFYGGDGVKIGWRKEEFGGKKKLEEMGWSTLIPTG